MKLTGNVAIVTGSAAGVGAATARLFATKGWNVVVNYSRSEDDAKETQAACQAEGGETLMVKADISDDSECRRLVEETIDNIMALASCKY